MIRYCDKCGCAITSGGHKSSASGLFSTPYLCDECYAAETDATVKAVGFLVRVIVGFFAGLAMTCGVTLLLSKAGRMIDWIDPKVGCIGIEVFALSSFIAGKVGTRMLKSKFLRFLCGVLAYFSFWMSIVYGIGMYFILKYGL